MFFGPVPWRLSAPSAFWGGLDAGMKARTGSKPSAVLCSSDASDARRRNLHLHPRFIARQPYGLVSFVCRDDGRAVLTESGGGSAMHRVSDVPARCRTLKYRSDCPDHHRSLAQAKPSSTESVLPAQLHPPAFRY